MSEAKCYTCEGSGRFYIPSDGYENAKRGPCGDCHGSGKLRDYAKYQLSWLRHYLGTREALLATLPDEIAELREKIQLCEKELEK